MNKIPKYVVIIVGILVMVVLLPLGYVRYKTRYEAEQISVSTSPDGDYELVIYSVGDPDFPFGAAHGRLVLKGKEKTVAYRSFEVANDGADNAGVAAVREFAATEGSEVFVICAEIEQEIAELDDDEKAMFLEELNMSESGLDRLIKASYTLLGLISYLTAGDPEVRAWTITKGTKAPQAAGKIHTDFERGFIRAEVVHYDDLMECGSMTAAKEKGLVRSEGKDYVMKDGDIVLFRFNV